MRVVRTLSVMATLALLAFSARGAFISFESRIAEPFPYEKIVKEEKDCGCRANNFSLGNGCAIHSSKDLNATFNVRGKSN